MTSSLLQITPYAVGDNAWLLVEGLNAADNDCYAAAGGGIALESNQGGSTADDEAILVRGANQSIVWNTIDNLSMLTVIKTAAAVTQVQYKIGLADDGSAGVADGADNSNASDVGDVEAVFTFDTDDSDTTWQVNHVASGTDEVEIDTGVTVVASTKYVLHVTVDTDQMATYFINGLEVYRATTALDSEAAGTDLGPHIGVSNLDTNTRILTVRRVVLVKDFND